MQEISRKPLEYYYSSDGTKAIGISTGGTSISAETSTDNTYIGTTTSPNGIIGNLGVPITISDGDKLLFDGLTDLYKEHKIQKTKIEEQDKTIQDLKGRVSDLERYVADMLARLGKEF